MRPRPGEIRLSEKHGVNPAIPVCYFCLKEKNEVILAGRLPDDREAPRHAVWDRRPCETCAGWMSAGVILVSVRDGEKGDNPYRTGGWVVMRQEWIERAITEPLRAQLLESRFAFVPDATWEALGLPREWVERV